MRLPTIEEITQGNVECLICGGWGWVCENHPGKVWDLSGCECGAGMPCRCTPYALATQYGGLA